MNVPNFLTLLRIVLIPVFLLLFYLPFHWSFYAAGIIFAVAAITDWLDGFLARSLKQTSRMGAFLDPVADKLVVVTALVLIVGTCDYPFIAIPSVVIIGREILVSALREWMAEVGKRANIAVSFIAKIKTFLQLIAVLLLLLGRDISPLYRADWIGILGYVLLYVAALLTLWSMVVYLRAAWPELSFKTVNPVDTTKNNSEN